MENHFFKNLPIWFINLDRSCNRYDSMLNHLADIGVSNFKRIKAIDGNEVDFSVKKSIHHDRDLSRTEAATTASYISALNKFVNSENEYIMLSDDDSDFSSSAHFDFNFYETLDYHNPKVYCLKTSSLDIEHWFPEKEYIKPNVLTRPSFTSYGSSMIINKLWASAWLKKYQVFGKPLESIDNKFIYKYKNNISNIPSACIPAADAITFDENTFVWRVFGTRKSSSTVEPKENTEHDNKSFLAYNKLINEYDWAKNSSIDVFKRVLV